jgi:hypothetical protein
MCRWLPSSVVANMIEAGLSSMILKRRKHRPRRSTVTDGSMSKLIETLNNSHSLVEDIRAHSEGLDAELFLEALMLDDSDFSEAMDGETMIAALKSEGLL